MVFVPFVADWIRLWANQEQRGWSATVERGREWRLWRDLHELKYRWYTITFEKTFYAKCLPSDSFCERTVQINFITESDTV